jgi:Zn-dependent protease
MTQIYAIDSTRISHREYWWGTRSPLVLLGWMLKWLRVRIPGSTDDPNFESTLPWVVEALPEDVAERFAPLMNELGALGFHPVAYHCFSDPGTRTTIYWATFRHESSEHFARIHQRVWGQSQKVSRAIFPLFLTEFTDGTFFVSSSGKPDLLTPAAVPMNRMPGAATAGLWAAHLARVAAHGAQRLPVRLASTEDVLAATERHHVLLRDFNLARGVFRSRDAAEQARADQFAATVAQAQAGGLPHAEVLAELDALQQHKPGWGGTLWVLLVSIVAFVLLGAAHWDWKFTLWLIPVLLFHEAGHWVAMRIFRYRNLRMFFIPLFGAAVTGRHWNVPGWKKGIVSLAGPLPGIALGSLLAVGALILETPWLNELAFMLLILNGFNLLPVLPLDGGHVLHATLFCRNRWLDIVFRCAAIGGLILMGLTLSKFMLWIGVALGLGLPLAFKLGKVVDQMRRADLPAPPLDTDRIPPETAQAIISALKAEQPAGISSKLLAQQTLSVYETLNARPPGAPATLALLAVHAGAFCVSIVFCFLLMVGKFGGGFDHFVSSALRQPEHSLDCLQPIQTWRGGKAGADAAPRHLLVATLAQRAEAVQTFSNLTRRLPETARLTLFGDSLLLSLPAADNAARERWFGVLESRAPDAFIAPSNGPVGLSLFFVAPDEKRATNLAQELAAFGALPGARLIPPWSPLAKSAAYTNFLQARLAWLRLEQAEQACWSVPEMKTLAQRIAAASRRGDMAEVERLGEERTRLLADVRARQREQFETELSGTAAGPLVALHAQLRDLSFTNRVERDTLRRQIASRLGEEAGSTLAPFPSASSFWGQARSSGMIVEAPWFSLADPQTALPQVLAWLCDQQCTSIKYELHDGGFLGGTSAVNPEEVE